MSYMTAIENQDTRAPKRGNSWRKSLQEADLKGLDKTQARCAPVQPVQLISSSSCKLWGKPSAGGAIRVARSKHGPDDPRILVATPTVARLDPRRSRSWLIH